jgi:hypothetical protein
MPDRHEYTLTLGDQTYALLLSTGDDTDPPGAKSFYQAIGRVLVQWGRLENNIDLALRMIMHLPDGETIRSKKGTTSAQQFSEKIDLWKKAFETIQSLQPVRDEAIAIIEGAKALQEYRRTLVHSFWGDFDPGPPLSLKGILHSYRKGEHTVIQSVVQIVGLEGLSSKLVDLVIRTVAVVHYVDALRKASFGEDHRL